MRLFLRRRFHARRRGLPPAALRVASALLVAAAVSWSSVAAAQDLSLKGFKATVVDQKVTYETEVCSPALIPSKWAVYYDLKSRPDKTTKQDGSALATSTGCINPLNPTWRNIVWNNAPIGLYQSYAMVDPDGLVPELNEGNNVAGPIEVCVGPDPVIKSFVIEANGANVTYKVRVCNEGSMTARKFRMGVWHNRGSEPPGTQQGDVFKSLVALDAGKCEDMVIPGGLRPNGSFTAWARADAGDFVKECREFNNPVGPQPYSLSNPDLYVKSFTASVSSGTVTYKAKVCNKGTAAVTKFFVDVYYHRTKKIPLKGDPGDQTQPVQSLGPNDACKDLTFTRPATPDGDYQSYLQVDADDFISEPDEGNNLSTTLFVKVGKGGTPGGDGGGGGGGGSPQCTDSDGDGYGVGPGCKGVPDCDDNNPDINPGAKEICGDKIDQDCDLTPDDGCPGVDCKDNDGDGFGVGKDCVLADCNDNDKNVYPWAPEKCGDNKDDNCNKIADDGCPGRQCVDEDADGYGVGKGCPGPQDCAPQNFAINPGAKDKCGDGLDNDCDNVADDGCGQPVDKDGDGAFVGGTVKAQGQPDCDDTDPNVAPGKQEICGDGIDNNCNGTIDDGCPGVDCKDNDGDGWGVGKDCAIQDCDDNDKTVHPYAKEVCGDNKDNNCNQTVDDTCPGVDCVDKDGDGWGVGKGCKVSDCNDDDGGISPWAKEICGDGKDNDCDRSIDEGCVVCEDKDGDGHGIGPKCPSWDCDDADPKTYAGAKEVCDNKDNDCDGQVPAGESSCSADGDDEGGCGCAVRRSDGTCEQLPSAGTLTTLLLVLLGLAFVVRARR